MVDAPADFRRSSVAPVDDNPADFRRASVAPVDDDPADVRRASVAPLDAATPVAAAAPAHIPPAHIPPAKVYVEDEGEVEELFRPPPPAQRPQGVNPLVILTMALLSVVGTLALIIYTLNQNFEATESPSRATQLTPKQTAVYVDHNVTISQGQLHSDYGGAGIDTPDAGEQNSGGSASTDDYSS
ncbi:uncharacterized protein [Dermacentor andersoni]|uniref:uncharacterized protein n=1 Tax=Dermacentor andersoni TaxID=34620 RepID=UPI002416F22D|nr:uncharacterized protein LOC129388301 [Dermacentor andersoni]